MTRPQLPAWHYNRLLADLETDGPYGHCADPIALATKWVERLRRGPRPSKGLYLHGPVGSGKTSVAAAIAVEVDAAYWSMRDLIARCKEEMNNAVRESAVDRAVRVPVLVLDDIGKQRATPYVVEVTCDVLERRFDRGHLTIVTSNLSPGEMARYLGDAAWSRLRASSVDVAMVAQDLRVVA